MLVLATLTARCNVEWLMDSGDRAGVVDDFDRFFLELLPKVTQLVLRVIPERAVAEDIAAESFARAFARWSKVGRLPYRAAWVMRVAANLAIDESRRRARRARPSRPSPVEPDPAGSVALHATLVQALSRLPRSQKEATALRYLADLPEDDVSALLGISPGTVKSHLNRARATLRKQLGTDLEEIGHETNPL